jgi:hypothetical protein
LKNKNGYISIEAIISYSVLLIFILLIMSFFVYAYSSIYVSDQVYSLSGLTSDDVTSANITSFIGYAEAIVGYFLSSVTEMDALLFESKYANCDESEWRLEQCRSRLLENKKEVSL